MPLDIKSQPVQQHIESTIVNSESIKVGKSGSMKVDKRFLANLPAGSLFSGGGYGKTRSATQASESKNLLGMGSSKSFKYTLTSKDAQGNPVSILSTILHTEKHTANNDYTTGHLQGQIASQVAFELQSRYSKVMTLDQMNKISKAQQKDDNMKIAYLNAYINSKKMRTIYNDPAYNKRYPTGSATYLKILKDASTLKAIQNIINNHNRGILLQRERQELDGFEHWRAGSKSQTGIGTPGHMVKTLETKTDFDLAEKTRLEVGQFMTNDPSKMTPQQLAVALHIIDGYNTQYDAIAKIPAGQRTISQRIQFYNLDLHLVALNNKYINIVEYKRIREQEGEEKDVESFRIAEATHLTEILNKIHNLKNLKNPQLTQEIDAISTLSQNAKTRIRGEEKKFPNIMAGKGESHKKIANAYGNQATIFRWINNRRVYDALTHGDFRALNSLPAMKGYIAPKPKPKPPPKPIAKVHKNPAETPKRTFSQLTGQIDTKLKKSLGGQYWSSTKNPTTFNSTDSYALRQAYTKTNQAITADVSKMNINQLVAHIGLLREAIGRNNLISMSKTDLEHHGMVDFNALTKLSKAMVTAEARYNILEVVKEKQDLLIKTNHSKIITKPIKANLRPDPLLKQFDNDIAIKTLIKNGKFSSSRTGTDATITNSEKDILSLGKAIEKLAVDPRAKSTDRATTMAYLKDFYIIIGLSNKINSSLVDNTIKSKDYIKYLNLITATKDNLNIDLNHKILNFHKNFKAQQPASQTTVKHKTKQPKPLATAQQLTDAEYNKYRNDRAFSGWLNGAGFGSVGFWSNTEKDRRAIIDNYLLNIKQQSIADRVKDILSKRRTKPSKTDDEGKGTKATDKYSGIFTNKDFLKWKTNTYDEKALNWSGKSLKDKKLIADAYFLHRRNMKKDAQASTKQSGINIIDIVKDYQKIIENTTPYKAQKEIKKALSDIDKKLKDNITPKERKQLTDLKNSLLNIKPRAKGTQKKVNQTKAEAQKATDKANPLPKGKGKPTTTKQFKQAGGGNIPTKNNPNLKGKKLKNIKFHFHDSEDHEELIDEDYLYLFYLDSKGVKTYLKPYRMILGYKEPMTAKELVYYHNQLNFIGGETIETKKNQYLNSNGMGYEALNWLGGAIGAGLAMSNNRAGQEIVGFLGRQYLQDGTQNPEDDQRTNLFNDLFKADKQELEETNRLIEQREQFKLRTGEERDALRQQLVKRFGRGNREQTPGELDTYATEDLRFREATEVGDYEEASRIDTDRQTKIMVDYAESMLKLVPEYTQDQFIVDFHKATGRTMGELELEQNRERLSYDNFDRAFNTAKAKIPYMSIKSTQPKALSPPQSVEETMTAEEKERIEIERGLMSSGLALMAERFKQIEEIRIKKIAEIDANVRDTMDSIIRRVEIGTATNIRHEKLRKIAEDIKAEKIGIATREQLRQNLIIKNDMLERIEQEIYTKYSTKGKRGEGDQITGLRLAVESHPSYTPEDFKAKSTGKRGKLGGTKAVSGATKNALIEYLVGLRQDEIVQREERRAITKRPPRNSRTFNSNRGNDEQFQRNRAQGEPQGGGMDYLLNKRQNQIIKRMDYLQTTIDDVTTPDDDIPALRQENSNLFTELEALESEPSIVIGDNERLILGDAPRPNIFQGIGQPQLEPEGQLAPRVIQQRQRFLTQAQKDAKFDAELEELLSYVDTNYGSNIVEKVLGDFEPKEKTPQEKFNYYLERFERLYKYKEQAVSSIDELPLTQPEPLVSNIDQDDPISDIDAEQPISDIDAEQPQLPQRAGQQTEQERRETEQFEQDLLGGGLQAPEEDPNRLRRRPSPRPEAVARQRDTNRQYEKQLTEEGKQERVLIESKIRRRKILLQKNNQELQKEFENKERLKTKIRDTKINYLDLVEPGLKIAKVGVEGYQAGAIGYRTMQVLQPLIIAGSKFIFPTVQAPDDPEDPDDDDDDDDDGDGDGDPNKSSKPKTDRTNKPKKDLTAEDLRKEFQFSNEEELSQFLFDNLRRTVASVIGIHKIANKETVIETLRILADPKNRRDASEIINQFNRRTGLNLPDLMFFETQGDELQPQKNWVFETINRIIRADDGSQFGEGRPTKIYKPRPQEGREPYNYKYDKITEYQGKGYTQRLVLREKDPLPPEELIDRITRENQDLASRSESLYQQDLAPDTPPDPPQALINKIIKDLPKSPPKRAEIQKKNS